MAVESKTETPEGGGGEEPAGGGARAAPELLGDVQKCLEQLLSKSNLAEDAFIQQQMDSQMYIPLCILAAHNAIGKLGAPVSIDTLLAAAQRSEALVVDAEKMLIRPNFKNRRNTLILHDLPEGIQEEELRELFKACSKFGNLDTVKPDVNRTAFITFNTDESAQAAALWLRSQKLRGSSIHCAMKSDHAVRSFFPMAPPGTSPALTAHSGGPWQASGQSWPPSPWMGPNNWPAGAGGAAAAAGYVAGEAWGCGGWKGAGDEEPGFGFDKGCKGKGRGKRGKGEGPPSGHMDIDAAMAAAHAEGMGGMGLPDADNGDANEFNDVEVGYKHEFRRYTRQEIIEICSAMEDVPKPESFAKFEKEDTGSILLRPNPCKDWAPLPTPLTTFSALPGEGRRGAGGDDKADEHNEHGARNRRNSRPGRKAPPEGKGRAEGPGAGASKGKGRPDGEQEGHQEGKGSWGDPGWDWYAADGSSWGAYPAGSGGGSQERASSRRRAAGRPWAGGGSGDWGGEWAGGDWGANEWHGPTWQAKEPQAGDAPPDAEEAASRGPRDAASAGRPSWAEKVKEVRGADKGTAPQRWEVKKKLQEGSAPTSPAGGAPAAAAATDDAAEAPEESGAGAVASPAPAAAPEDAHGGSAGAAEGAKGAASQGDAGPGAGPAATSEADRGGQPPADAAPAGGPSAPAEEAPPPAPQPPSAPAVAAAPAEESSPAGPASPGTWADKVRRGK